MDGDIVILAVTAPMRMQMVHPQIKTIFLNTFKLIHSDPSLSGDKWTQTMQVKWVPTA